MMRMILVVAAGVTGLAALAPALEACGDKFLVVGRGASFQRVYASVYPGTVLIYARPATNDKAAIRDPQLHKALRQAGHSVNVIEDWGLLQQALKTLQVDVVLVDVGEQGRIQPVVASSASTPDTLYVAGRTGVPPQICKLKANDKSIRFLDEIESAMKARAKRAKG